MMIPPPAQRAMSERAKATVTETPANHAVYVSQPAVVAAVITQAAQEHGAGPRKTTNLTIYRHRSMLALLCGGLSPVS
jgi:hypothetical protein